MRRLRGPYVEFPACLRAGFGSDGVTLVPLEVRGGMEGRWCPDADRVTLVPLDVRGGMVGRRYPVTLVVLGAT